MHVLCILRTLPLPGSGDRKEGVYPVMLRAHVRAGFRTALAVQAAELGSEVVDGVRLSVLHEAGERLWIEEVRAVGAVDADDLVAAGRQMSHEVTPDEARSAGHE